MCDTIRLQETEVDEPFGFIGRFCFDKGLVGTYTYRDVGRIHVELTFPFPIFPPLNLSVFEYHDGPESWQPISHPDTSCIRRVSSIYHDDPTPLVPGTGDKNHIYTMTRHVKGSSRTRFFFYGVSLTDTSCQDIPPYKARVHFTRLDIPWNEELGANTVGLNTLYLVLAIIYTILLILHIHSVRKLTAKLEYLHPVIKYFTIIFIILYLSVILKVIYYIQLSAGGLVVTLLNRAATAIDGISRIAFVVLLLLLAKGWTIVTTNLEDRTSVISLSVIFALLYLFSIGFSYASYDPQQVRTTDGVVVVSTILMAVGLIFAVWFVVQAYSTYKKENTPLKQRFFLLLSVCYGIYLSSVPIVSFLSFILDPCVRERLTEGFTACATCSGISGLTFLMWHTRSDKYFVFDNPVTDGSVITIRTTGRIYD